MNTRHAALVLGCLLVLGLFGACSGDDPIRPGEDPDVLLTVEFENYLIFEQPREGFVFISDQDGRVLDCAPWTSTSKIELRNADIHPETISFTIFENSDTRPSFTTEVAVPSGSVRRFPVRPYPTQTGQALITLRNLPDTRRFYMSANYRGYSGQTQPPPRYILDVMGESTDLYAMVVPIAGAPIGGWLRSLRAGDRDTVDFESTGDVATLDAVTIDIPAGAERGNCKARARVPNGLPDGLMLVDSFSWYGYGLDSLTFYLPPLDPADWVLEFYQEYPGEIGTFYWQEIRGHLPSTLTNLEGDLVVVTASPDSVVIAASFAWDRFLSGWRQEKDVLVSWLIEGPVSTEARGLPEIPSEVADVIPEFPREGFTMSVVEVYQENSDGVVRSQGKKFPTTTKNGDAQPMRPQIRQQR